MNEEKTAYYIQLFDDYIDGNISAQQEEEIKSALKDNPFLNEVLQQHVQARANIRVEGEKILKEKLSSRFEHIPTEEVTNRIWIKYIVILLVLLGLAAIAYYFLSQKNTDAIELPSLAEIEDPSYDVMRSDNTSETNIAWQAAMSICASGKYAECLGEIIQIDDQDFIDKNTGKYFLMQGISRLKLGEFAKARIDLDAIPKDNPYSDQAEWYNALSYYYQKNKGKALEAFENIASDNSHYKNKEVIKFMKALK